LKSPDLDYSLLPKIQHLFQKTIYFPVWPVAKCWLSPLVDNCQSTYLIMFLNKKTLVKSIHHIPMLLWTISLIFRPKFWNFPITNLTYFAIFWGKNQVFYTIKKFK
jgi:hypothetical protein